MYMFHWFWPWRGQNGLATPTDPHPLWAGFTYIRQTWYTQAQTRKTASWSHELNQTGNQLVSNFGAVLRHFCEILRKLQPKGLKAINFRFA